MTGGGKSKYLNKNLSQCQLIHLDLPLILTPWIV